MKDAVMDSKKHVAVLVCVQWHGGCRRTQQIWADLAQRFAVTDLTLATIDAERNDVYLHGS